MRDTLQCRRDAAAGTVSQRGESMQAAPEITIQGVEVKPLRYFHDPRGWLTEIYRDDELSVRPVMSYVSLTHPGVARGPHEHRDQADVFVFMGPSTFRMYMWDNRSDSPTHGRRMVFETGERWPSR